MRKKAAGYSVGVKQTKFTRIKGQRQSSNPGGTTVSQSDGYSYESQARVCMGVFKAVALYNVYFCVWVCIEI